MKTRLIILILLVYVSVFGQEKKKDSLLQPPKIFSFSPIHSKITQVNGLVVGAGHYENKRINHQKINGINIDVLHPAPLLLMSFGLEIPFRSILMGLTYKDGTDMHILDSNDYQTTQLTMNGLNLSVGGFMNGTNFNGLNISVFSATNRLNGISIAPVLNGSGVSNGVQIAALSNFSVKGNGLQLGISNVSERLHGIQIGLFNKSNDQRGIQLGLWNRNSKRSLPFINWQFKG
ncbi:LA_2272 family surface repeat-containing protein [Aquimarina sp. 2201CG5-10]|uniref:LA_2272 family surface repeat-containing protein n=1 Tax=Aquimarina callyspongiae TaxID=3098150 RepID=UPI002AB34A65|nr:hypothetical protein [Aquimarina sp. 2201CG5-10]MDY8138826.1 hypothetical protein [Aquimarina sp. 2201CG5-10]